MSSFAAHAFMRAGQRVMLLIEKMKKPVIAAVNGFALGGGLELALACDFIYASEEAKLGLPEVGLGIMPGFGGTQNLARLIGPNKAKELIFTGKTITAQKALAWGIVNEVFAPEELMAKTMETAREIAGKGTLGVRYSKDSVANGINMSQGGRLPLRGIPVRGAVFDRTDQREGMAHLLPSENRHLRENSQLSVGRCQLFVATDDGQRTTDTCRINHGFRAQPGPQGTAGGRARFRRKRDQADRRANRRRARDSRRAGEKNGRNGLPGKLFSRAVRRGRSGRALLRHCGGRGLQGLWQQRCADLGAHLAGLQPDLRLWHRTNRSRNGCLRSTAGRSSVASC